MNNSNNGFDSDVSQPKDNKINTVSQNKYFQTQMECVFNALSRPKTMLMVSIETGILRANICRYIAILERQNRIHLVNKTICPISKHRAGFYINKPLNLQ